MSSLTDGVRRGRVPVVVLIVIAACVIALGSVAATDRQPTKGRMPAAAMHNGQIDLSLAPDFIEALGRDGEIVGYIPKEYLGAQTPVDTNGDELPLPVYADDLTTLIGSNVAGVGFVPLGVRPESLPTFEVTVAPAD